MLDKFNRANKEEVLAKWSKVPGKDLPTVVLETADDVINTCTPLRERPRRKVDLIDT